MVTAPMFVILYGMGLGRMVAIGWQGKWITMILLCLGHCQFTIQRYTHPHVSVNGRFFDNHKALSLGILGVFAALVLAVYPLSFACRRHKRRRRPVSPNQGFRLDDPGNSYDRDAGVSYDSVGVSEGGSFIESKNEMGNGSHYSREDETGTGLASHEMPVSESTPLMKYKGSNKFRATKLSEVAIARRQEAQERYRGSELVIKTT